MKTKKALIKLIDFNKVNGVYLTACFESINTCLQEGGLVPEDYEVVFHDGKIHHGDCVMFVDEAITEEKNSANVIVESIDNSNDRKYFYKLT